MEPNTNGELDLIIKNVVSTFRTTCELDLHTIANEGINVIQKPKRGVRDPP